MFDQLKNMEVLQLPVDFTHEAALKEVTEDRESQWAWKNPFLQILVQGRSLNKPSSTVRK